MFVLLSVLSCFILLVLVVGLACGLALLILLLDRVRVLVLVCFDVRVVILVFIMYVVFLLVLVVLLVCVLVVQGRLRQASGKALTRNLHMESVQGRLRQASASRPQRRERKQLQRTERQNRGGFIRTDAHSLTEFAVDSAGFCAVFEHLAPGTTPATPRQTSNTAVAQAKQKGPKRPWLL